jgi:plasmid maintenance system antidote protein VapI
MTSVGLAIAMGVPHYAADQLLAGRANIAVALKLGVLQHSLQDFINGRASIGMALLLGTLVSNAQELRNKIGRDGAIGLLVGLCIAKTQAGR